MKITKNQLRRIIKEEKQKLLEENRVRKAVRRSLIEMGHGGLTVSTDVDGYTDGKKYVTNGMDHDLDQLQDLIDMGVKRVIDDNAGGEVYALRDWIPIVIDAARENREDKYKGLPKRWRGER